MSPLAQSMLSLCTSATCAAALKRDGMALMMQHADAPDAEFSEALGVLVGRIRELRRPVRRNGKIVA